jgi:hypothetical protein
LLFLSEERGLNFPKSQVRDNKAQNCNYSFLLFFSVPFKKASLLTFQKIKSPISNDIELCSKRRKRLRVSLNNLSIFKALQRLILIGTPIGLLLSLLCFKLGKSSEFVFAFKHFKVFYFYCSYRCLLKQFFVQLNP